MTQRFRPMTSDEVKESAQKNGVWRGVICPDKRLPMVLHDGERKDAEILITKRMVDRASSTSNITFDELIDAYKKKMCNEEDGMDVKFYFSSPTGFVKGVARQ